MIKVIPYILLGFPDIEKSYKAIEEFLADPKIRFIELGMPSKDPFKDGEIIRHFQNDLISKNFYLDDYLNFIADNFKPYEIKKFIPMGYLKDIEEYGIENFNEKVSKIGFAGMICIHDTSESEKLKMLKLPTIPVVSCDSSGSFMKEKFLKKPPFIYFVSGNGKTGETVIHSNDILRKALTMIRKKIPGIPVYAGFGIDSHEKAKKMIDIGFDGIIVGSALLNSLEEGITASEFLENLRGKKNEEPSL
ncbi:MAG: tryptophan synthase alpha chain [Kosmotogales bacterium]|nr:tryptophan synthase alpha chain [Kosmotogales bacterium]